MNLDQFGGRKFILAMSVLASASALCALHHIADGVYSAVVISTAGVYIAGNVAQKIGVKPT